MKNLAELFAAIRQPAPGRAADAGSEQTCLSCAADLSASETYQRLRVCPSCRFHYTIGGRERVATLIDEGTFRERNRALISIDPIAFARGYKRRLFEEERRTGMSDAIVTGTGTINGREVVLAVIDFRFLGGTIGSVVGEKLTQALELAARRHRPAIVVIASGGARMQEGPLALMQTAKIAMARERLAASRTPLLCVLTNPTLGAAYAGIGALGDFVVAEPQSLVGYVTARGDRAGEQTAEQQLTRGLLDEVVDRERLPGLLTQVLDALTARTHVNPENDERPAATQHHHGQAWNQVQIARHQQRPAALDYIGRMASTYVELRGDRTGTDSHAITCGIAIVAGEAVVIIGQQRPAGPRDDPSRDAWLGPEAFRKAARAIRLAHRFGLPILTLIDTPGADPRPAATAAGLGPALADCLSALATAPVPTIAAVIGEGGSEAAAALAVADRVLMLEHAIYTVVSPEQAAVLLHRDASRADEIADALHLTADACHQLGVVDVIVREPAGGAHLNHDDAARNLRAALLRALSETQRVPAKRLLRERYARYRRIGEYSGYIGTTLAHEVSELRTAIARKAGAAAGRVRHPRRGRDLLDEPGALLIP